MYKKRHEPIDLELEKTYLGNSYMHSSQNQSFILLAKIIWFRPAVYKNALRVSLIKYFSILS